NEQNLNAELSSLQEKFERSQQELEMFKGSDGSSSQLVADLTAKLASAKNELFQEKNDAK
ncbi:hypothetical protein MKX03_012427, partial [Papaver bracteatum]